MQVPRATPQTRPSSQGLGYLQPAEVDYSGITHGLNSLARGASTWAEKTAIENEQAKRFKALDDFNNFELKTQELLTQSKQTSPADAANFPETWAGAYDNLSSQFISTLPPDQQDEFKVRTGHLKLQTMADAMDFSTKQRYEYSKAKIDKRYNEVSAAVEQSPDTFEAHRDALFDYIDRAPGLSNIEKETRKATVSRDLGGIAYAYEYKTNQTERLSRDDRAPVGGHAQIITESAKELGVSPTELAAVMLYETGGTLSPDQWGGKNGDYMGLIQFGPVERAKYGVRPGQTFGEQMKSVVSYLKDRGFKSGMGIRDLYSTINAGKPGLYNASDRPGETVDSHVKAIVEGAAGKKAEALMNGKLDMDGFENDPKFADVPFEDRMQLRAHADAQLNAEIAAQQKERAAALDAAQNDLFIKLHTGKAGRKEIDEYSEAHLLDDYDKLNKAETILKEYEAEGQWAREGAVKLGVMGRGGSANFLPTDGDDNKRLDAVIGDDGLAKIGAGDGNYVDKYLIPLVRTAHVVPSKVAGTLESMIRSNDAPKALWAMDIMSRIRNEDPAAFNQRFDGQLARDVDFWDAKHKFYDQKELLNQIRGGNTAEQRSNRVLLRQDGENLIKEGKVDPQDYVNNFASLFSSNPEMEHIPWVAAEIGRDFNAVFAEEYSRYGNKDEAEKATYAAMNRVYGVTNVGTKTLMKYPPETVGYSPLTPGGDLSWTEREARHVLNIPADHQMQLISDNDTEKEVASWKSNPDPATNHPPAYQVVVKGPDDRWRSVLDADGQPARMYFKASDEEIAHAQVDWDLKKAQADYATFQREVYIPRHAGRFNLPGPVDQELEAKKKGMEDHIKGLHEQLGLPPETPALPHPVFDPRYRSAFIRGSKEFRRN